jgi:hygromycin-B 4-O-kinase
MSTPKTRVDVALVEQFLRNRFGSVAEMSTLAGGEISQAFSFVADGEKLVIRVCWFDRGFRKDRIAHDHFASPALPIPEVLDLGAFGEGLYYAITPFADGGEVRDLDRDSVVVLLDAIHGTDVSHSTGFGEWGEDGNGTFASWADAVEAEAQVDEAVFALPFVRRSIFDRLARGVAKNLPFVPDERRLVHGDFGFDNLFAEGDRITAVTDWAMSRYGDPLWDVAWVTSWTVDRSLADRYRAYAQAAGRHLVEFERRLTCYECRIALIALSFLAVTGREAIYRSHAAGLERYLSGRI